MRRAFTQVGLETLRSDERAALLLCDIGVYGFREALHEFPARALNLGILEQATVGVAAGMAKAGLIPIVHTIAPFLVERALEQIKIDLAYQQLPAKLVSVGASVDYAALGPTHHCPGDIAELGVVPEVELIVPGTSDEFTALFRQSFSQPTCTYFRLSEVENTCSEHVEIGEPTLLQQGTELTVLSVGPVKDLVASAIGDLDVSHVYLTSLRPLNADSLAPHVVSRRVVIVEPVYTGTVGGILMALFPNEFLEILSIGFPREFRRHYGKREEHMEAVGLTTERVRQIVLSAL